MIYKFEKNVIDYGCGYGKSMRFYYSKSSIAAERIERVISIESKHIPGCCGVSVLFNIALSDAISEKKFKKFLNSILKFYEEEELYGKILIYVITGSYIEKLFKSHERVYELYTFKNPRSENMLTALQVDLEVEQEKEEEDIF